jgi:large subunit ribosomal protein L15
MMIHDITRLAGAHKRRKRVGRGEGSGHGKQSGRGQKGAKSRSGYAAKRGHEGGQMPYFRRLAKFGFTNAPFRNRFWIVNLRDIVAHPAFASGGVVDASSLIKAGLVRDTSRDLKILGAVGEDGLTVRLEVTAQRVSASARRLIEQAGGKVVETGTRRDRVRGIDRNAEDKAPRNLTRKLKRRRKALTAAVGEGKSSKAEKNAKGDAT